MRRSTVGLAVVGLLMGAGCGGDDGGGDGNSAEGSGGGSTEEFCAGFNDVNEQFPNLDPLEEPEQFDEAVGLLQDLDAPEEVADDYARVLEGFEAFADVDASDQEALAEVAEEFSDAQDELTALTNFVEQEC